MNLNKTNQVHIQSRAQVWNRYSLQVLDLVSLRVWHQVHDRVSNQNLWLQVVNQIADTAHEA